MDAAPFRSFLGKRIFAGANELIQAIATCRETSAFVHWALDLRWDPRTRRTPGDVLHELTREELGFKPAVWFTRDREEIFNLWRLLHQRCKPRSNERQDDIPVGYPEKKRKELARLGVGKSKGMPLSIRAQAKCKS